MHLVGVADVVFFQDILCEDKLEFPNLVPADLLHGFLAHVGQSDTT